ncbi:SRPBCC domain-containing protein [Kribbella sp. NPDC056861]|uniref:SRPBCC domain-containing protein n=1 Tax=Kribbella sp. NPDC056861 TaxID=3154857 RepID=UPI00343C4E4A
MSDFSTSVTIAASPAVVFAAILDTKGWWNQDIEGPTAQIGDEFRFEVEGLHRTRIRVTDVTPAQRVEWLIVENYFGFVKDQNEWVGDRLVFDLEPTADGTTVRFTQYGLVPELECYDVCSNAWGFYIGESLRTFTEQGQGDPESAAGHAAPAEQARAAINALESA